MNYESRQLGGDDRAALPDFTAPRAGRGRRVLIVVGIVLVVAVAIWALFLRGHTAPPHAAPVEQVPSVTVVVPGRSTIDRELSANGTLAAKREMPVGIAGEGGMVRQVLVEPGQWVQAGQVLATIDRSVQTQTAASLAASIKVAQADATLAQSELDRAQQLVSRGFISRADIETKTATRDAAAARVRVAQAQLAQQQATNGRLDIRAPAAGLVLTRQVEPGQIVNSGSGTLFRMAKDGLLEMRAALSEGDLATVHPGARATVTPVGSTDKFSGVVWQVAPVIDPTTRQGIARIQLAYDPSLRPGGFAAATIVSGANVAPLLPDSVLQSDDKGNFVYVVDANDKVERRNVKIGQVADAGVTILDGLTGNERVVVSAGGFLAPGQKVKPILQKAS